MTPQAETADEELIGRSYTKARRSPLVYGMVPGAGGRNFRLPFGPYTVTQLGVLVGAVGLLVLSRPVWGGHGVADLAVLIVVPFAASFAFRYAHVDGRNPAAAAASVAAMLAGPRCGRLHGRPYTPARPQHASPRITVAGPGAFPDAAPAPTPAPVPASTPAPYSSTPAPPEDSAPADPAPGRGAGPAVASGVQSLLTQPTNTPTGGIDVLPRRKFGGFQRDLLKLREGVEVRGAPADQCQALPAQQPPARRPS